MTTHTLTVPALFWTDHSDRGCTDAETEILKGRRYTLVLSDEALEDLESDAKYYATCFQGEDWAADPYGRSIVRSAKRTWEIIQAYRREAR
jgi:hypothetical protein